MATQPNVTPLHVAPAPAKRERSLTVKVVFGVSAVATILGAAVLASTLNGIATMSAARMMPAPTANIAATVNVPKQPVQVVQAPTPKPKVVTRTVVREVPVFVELR